MAFQVWFREKSSEQTVESHIKVILAIIWLRFFFFLSLGKPSIVQQPLTAPPPPPATPAHGVPEAQHHNPYSHPHTHTNTQNTPFHMQAGASSQFNPLERRRLLSSPVFSFSLALNGSLHKAWFWHQMLLFCKWAPFLCDYCLLQTSHAGRGNNSQFTSACRQHFSNVWQLHNTRAVGITGRKIFLGVTACHSEEPAVGACTNANHI